MLENNEMMQIPVDATKCLMENQTLYQQYMQQTTQAYSPFNDKRANNFNNYAPIYINSHNSNNGLMVITGILGIGCIACALGVIKLSAMVLGSSKS